MFPMIEPYATGFLPVGEGHELYWETSGNPHGKPALYLHGGPGGGLLAGHRRRFDPDRYRLVAFEQRGCGRSRPLVSPSTLASNTTQALIEDIEALRTHLGIERWLVHGISWGTTLALAYAEAHPTRASELVLTAIGTTSAAEVEWATEAMRNVFPEAWERFEVASKRAPGERLVDAYYTKLTSADPQARERAAAAWCAWEDVHVSLGPGHGPTPQFQDPAFRQTFATLVVHYWKHAAFLEPDALFTNLPRIAHVPAALIHGRLDVSSPLATAWRLHRSWCASGLVVIEDEGHGGEAMIAETARAISRFA